MVFDLTDKFPLMLPYGLKCAASHLALYVIFRSLLPTSKNVDGRSDDYIPWKKSPSLTAHKIVAIFIMCHWCFLGFRHLWSYDYNATSANAGSESNLAALKFVPAGYDIAQYSMGALLFWDIPLSLVGGSGPVDLLMHIHHAGMVLAISCVMGFFGDIVGTHVAPIFFGAIELSSIPLQIVDLFHPSKSPYWNKFINNDLSPSSFPKLCYIINEISRILFAILFLLVRALYFPYVVATIAAPDFYAEGSLPSKILFVLCILFTLLQLYWGALVFKQVNKAIFGSGKESKKNNSSKDE